MALNISLRCVFMNLPKCLRKQNSLNLFNSYTTRSSVIFGIETSCDDTGCAIVNTDGQLLGECLISQQELHTKLGGIIPPIAKEMHEKNIDRAVKETLSVANIEIADVDAVAVTVKPGLAMSLGVGVNCAKSLCTKAKKPLIPIHHMEAHALTVRMTEKVDFPFLVLLISGGHSLIGVAESINKFLLLGKTVDDAPGEAFDKIARRLKVWNLDGYDSMSGGRAIEVLSRSGNPYAFPVAEPLLQYNDCNFSFAGIKNSSRQFIVEEEKKQDVKGGDVLANIEDIAASVQFSITKHLCRRIQRAMIYAENNSLLSNGNRQLVVSGGVASNSMIKKGLNLLCNEMGYSLHVPPKHLCTDNGIMIAWNGVEKWKAGIDIIPYAQVHTVDFQPNDQKLLVIVMTRLLASFWPLGHIASEFIKKDLHGNGPEILRFI